jgi:RHS repeat-associated protein
MAGDKSRLADRVIWKAFPGFPADLLNLLKGPLNRRGIAPDPSVLLLTGADTPPIRYEIRRSYTALGQPASVHLVSADGESVALDHKVDYSWNAHGQLVGVKSLAGEFVYGYDQKNPALLTKMTGPVHEVETTYEPHRDLITGVTNRRKVAASGDGSPRPLAEEAPISSYAYSNDILGRRETISQGGEAFAMQKLGDTKVDVAYNERSEVVGAVYKGANENRQSFSYDYDGIGNRRSFQSTVNGEPSTVAYETNALNQYQKISGNQREFDDKRGGEAGRPSPASPSIAVGHDLDGNLIEDHKNRYTWDSENRLTRVESKDGTLHLDYVYDHQSRRMMGTETKNPGKANEEQKTTYYVYDDWNLLAELEETKHEEPGTKNYVQRTFTWGRDLSGSLQGAGGVGGLLAITEGEEHRFPAYDANGNVGQLINEQCHAMAAYSYDPFGNVTEMAGAEAAANPWRFSTKPVEAGTGWLYYGFRYYQPETGRWLNRDPIEESGGTNLYRSFGNDGIGRYDILGNWSPAGSGAGSCYDCHPGGRTGPFPDVGITEALEDVFGWVLGRRGPSSYGANDPRTLNIKQSGVVKKLRDAFVTKNSNKKCNQWDNLTGAGLIFGPREFIRDALAVNATAHFVGSADGDVYIYNVDTGSCTVTATFEIRNRTSLRSLIYHITPNSWNNLNLGTPFANWDQTYMWEEDFHCSK